MKSRMLHLISNIFDMVGIEKLAIANASDISKFDVQEIDVVPKNDRQVQRDTQTIIQPKPKVRRTEKIRMSKKQLSVVISALNAKKEFYATLVKDGYIYGAGFILLLSIITFAFSQIDKSIDSSLFQISIPIYFLGLVTIFILTLGYVSKRRSAVKEIEATIQEFETLL